MQEYKQLYIFVEGSDDKRFFQTVIEPKVQKAYNYIKFIEYARKKKIIVINYLKTINKEEASDYLFICDYDKQSDSYCVSKRKQKEIAVFGDVLKENKIRIVKEEIESWYLAGITTDKLKEYHLRDIKNTERVNKEKFTNLIPKQFQNKTDFLMEILKDYSIEKGRARNKSLDYFISKLAI